MTKLRTNPKNLAVPVGASFSERLLPAPPDGGFRMDGYWVWCGSPARGDDGRYHLFASRWPRTQPFAPGWLTHSEVVRADAVSATGPYVFREVVLPARGPEWWDGRMTHNPTIHRAGNLWLLFYTGTTYAFPPPDPGIPATREQVIEARGNQRIGLATAPSPAGPWTRRETPILDVRPGKWDAFLTTNPAACLVDDDVLLVYKSTRHNDDLLRLGVARAERPDGPYRRAVEGPLFDFGASGSDPSHDPHVEDPYVWWTGGRFEMIAKDLNGAITGELGAGLHGWSDDGNHWHLSDPPLAFSRTVHWSDGRATRDGQLERPQLLIEDGVPTHLFLAMNDAERPSDARTSRNIVVPLARP